MMITRRRHRALGGGTSTAIMLLYFLSSQCAHAFTSYTPFLSKRNSCAVSKSTGKSRLWLHQSRRRLAETSSRSIEHLDEDDSILIEKDKTIQEPSLQSRRLLLQGIGMAAIATSAPLAAHAGKAELDLKTGELFSPKAEMIRGGSDAARGIRQQSQPKRIQPGQTVQTVYETRFIAYLTRFLLTFDPPSHAWWLKQGFQDSWEQELSITDTDRSMEEARFAEFAESVEVGLADYFTGPYGSYASVSAAKAGINAAAPAKAARVPDDESIWNILSPKPKRQKTESDVVQMSKQGILNLYALLKARYTSVSAKRQMAILFSLISSPKLQPVNEIRSLLGEADNATITKIEFERGTASGDEAKSRTSSRRGGGYSINDPPKINIDAPPALGDRFPGPVTVPKMKPTSRILRINVVDGGAGYDSPPVVSVRQNGFRRVCEACAIMDREGHVESILVLDPGYGYDVRGKRLPEVMIEAPKRDRKVPRRAKTDKSVPSSEHRRAKAVVELEYEIVGIDLIDGGNGYSGSERPSISISSPAEYPDWYYSSDELFGGQLAKEAKPMKGPTARVVEMKLGDGTVLTEPIQSSPIDTATINLLKRDALELLPTSVRPEQSSIPGDPLFGIPSLPPMPPQPVVPSARYRAYDPLFGGLGTVPVTMGALELSASEYSRIALGGAVCTVIVRTLLNPLELVKTKVQLKNDKELNEYAYEIARKSAKSKSSEGSNERSSTGGTRTIETVATNGTTAIALKEIDTMTLTREEPQEEKTAIELGTMDVIKSIVELRGPLALFQSADITFLASIVFGSFGFGATELFRRYFTATFMSETSSGSGGTTATLVLLAAAAVACVITSAAATPFEVLRVRSMGLVEAKPWKEVFVDYVNENRREAAKKQPRNSTLSLQEGSLLSIAADDLLPLWGGFPPTLSRELPFAIAKFLAFDLIANAIVGIVNSQAGEGALPVQVGAGTVGLAISAISGAVAGIAGAIVSHPADLILTLTSASKGDDDDDEEDKGWKEVVQDLISQDGGIANLFLGFPARASFFFMVIGLQFFLYDYVKNLFQVGSDDLSLVLDVFYAVRQGL